MNSCNCKTFGSTTYPNGVVNTVTYPFPTSLNEVPDSICRWSGSRW
jgi:hypothetical protein